MKKTLVDFFASNLAREAIYCCYGNQPKGRFKN